VLIEFAGGLFASVMTGFTIQQYRSPALEVYGTKGVIQMLGDDWDPDGYELWQNHMGAWQLFKETQPDWAWTAGLTHLVECIEKRSKPRVTLEHAYHVLEIISAARESALKGSRLKIKSTFPRLKAELPSQIEAAHLVHDRTRSHKKTH